MNDLEELLREDLRAATDWLPDDVDPEEVLGVGRRVRRSRRISRTVLAGAVVVVVGLVGSTVWRSLQPAPGVPSPLQTVSAVPSDPATPSDPLSTTFDLHDQGFGKGGASLQSIRVSVEPAGAETAVQITVAYPDKAPVERGFTITSGTSWHVAWDKHLMIGILPGQVDWFTLVNHSGTGVYSGTSQELAGIGASAMWTYFEESGGPGSVQGVIWRTADGTVRDSLGNSVPSATITLSNDTYLVYQDADLDYLGIDPGQDGGRYGSQIPEVSDILHGGFGTRTNDGEWIWHQAAVLPAGAHDLELTLGKGDAEWGSAVLDDGSVAVVAELRGVSEPGNVVRSLSYTDASGERVTVRK
jgi:hypothetical protein